MSRKLDRERPELAAKFYTAFEKAKQLAYDDTLSDRGGFSVRLFARAHEGANGNLGRPWKYGFKANKTTIDTFIKYNVEQGMIRAAPTYSDIFAAGTLETYSSDALNDLNVLNLELLNGASNAFQRR